MQKCKEKLQPKLDQTRLQLFFFLAASGTILGIATSCEKKTLYTSWVGVTELFLGKKTRKLLKKKKQFIKHEVKVFVPV